MNYQDKHAARDVILGDGTRQAVRRYYLEYKHLNTANALCDADRRYVSLSTMYKLWTLFTEAEKQLLLDSGVAGPESNSTAMAFEWAVGTLRNERMR